MKKIFAGVCVLILLLGSSAATAAQESSSYTLDDLEITIAIPDELVVFTRDTPEDDPNYAAYGLTKEALIDLFDVQNIYLNAWDADINYEIVITMVDSSSEELPIQSDVILSEFASAMGEMYEDMGLAFLGAEIYQHTQRKFVKIYANRDTDDQTVYMVQYSTIHNYQAINIALHSYSGKISANEESLLKSIVDSIHFQDAQLPSDVGIGDIPLQYTDFKTGVSFSVPSTWIQKPLSEDRETIDVEFVPSSQEEGLLILYGSVDWWEQMTEAERMGLTRAGVNQNLLTKEDIAFIAKNINAESSQISSVTYAGKEYFKLEATISTQVGSFNYPFPVVVLFHAENGYLFEFQFWGVRTNSYFDDFVSLMNSVKYPSVENKTVSSTKSQTEQGVSPVIIVISVVIVILGVLFLCWVLRPQESIKSPSEEDLSTLESTAPKKSIGILKMYYDRESTPLAFHTFVRYVSLPLGFLSIIGQMISATSNAAGNYWLFNIDLLAYITTLALIVICFVGFIWWKPYAWYGMMVYLGFRTVYSAFVVAVYIAYAPNMVATVLGQFAAALIYGVLAGIYYLKRKPLFFEQMQLPLQDAVKDELRSSAVEKEPANDMLSLPFCPNCGARLMRGSTFCNQCGTKITRKDNID